MGNIYLILTSLIFPVVAICWLCCIAGCIYKSLVRRLSQTTKVQVLVSDGKNGSVSNKTENDKDCCNDEVSTEGEEKCNDVLDGAENGVTERKSKESLDDTPRGLSSSLTSGVFSSSSNSNPSDNQNHYSSAGVNCLDASLKGASIISISHNDTMSTPSVFEITRVQHASVTHRATSPMPPTDNCSKSTHLKYPFLQKDSNKVSPFTQVRLPHHLPPLKLPHQQSRKRSSSR